MRGGWAWLALAAWLDGPVAAVTAAEEAAQLDRIGVRDGLAQGSVNAIVRDARGFLWFGTENGLDRWDGYGFEAHRNRPGDPTSLASHFVWSLHAGRQCLWVGTNGGGLSCRRRESGRFETLRHDPGRPDSLPSDVVLAVLEEADGTVWVGTEAGLARLEWDGRSPLAAARLQPIAAPAGAGAAERAVRLLVREPGGPLWVATDRGLMTLQPGARRLTTDSAESRAVGALAVRGLDVAEDRLLVGTFRAGLLQLARGSGAVTRYRSRPGDAASIPSDTVITLNRDGAGGFWVGTPLGVARFDPRSGTFQHLLRSPGTGRPGGQPVLASLVEPDGTAWFGTWGDGVLRFDPRRERFARLVHVPDLDTGLHAGRGRAVVEDADGALWLGTFGGGIQRAWPTPQGLRYESLEMGHLDPAHRNVWALHVDAKGTLWAATDGGLLSVGRGRRDVREALPQPFLRALKPAPGGDLWIGSDSGLYRYRPGTGVVLHLTHDAKRVDSLRSDKVYAVAAEGDALWIGTWAGLARLGSGGAIERFVQGHARLGAPANLVWALHRDRRGRLWAGTSAGLVEIESRGARVTFAVFDASHGLPDDVVYCIAEDTGGRLWLSTNRGLAAFDPDARRVLRTFDESDGLPAAEFSFGACHAGARLLTFGGVSGFVRFAPEAVLEGALRPPPVVLTGLQLQGRPVTVGSDSGRQPPDGPRPGRARPLLTRPIEETTAIELTHRDASISLEFAALDFRAPAKNRYSFRLHGFDPAWSAPAPRRFATYTNLDPGDYVFQVKAAGADGAWNEEGVSLQVRVLPPWWRTPWFRGAALLGLLGLGLGFHRLRLRALVRRRHELEGEVRERTAELSHSNRQLALQTAELAQKHADLEHSRAQREELEAVFFHDVLNTSGALRGMLELMPMLEPAQRDDLQRRAQAVSFRLVEEIQAQRDLVDAERGSLQVRHEPLAPCELLANLRDHYADHASARGKAILLRCRAGRPLATDAVLLGRCLGNLLKNALEASAEGDVVRLGYDDDDGPCFTVNNASVIPEPAQARVFERAFSTKGGRGRGIGTYGVKLLVERCLGGAVTFVSAPDAGTTFTLRLPG